MAELLFVITRDVLFTIIHSDFIAIISALYETAAINCIDCSERA